MNKRVYIISGVNIIIGIIIILLIPTFLYFRQTNYLTAKSGEVVETTKQGEETSTQNDEIVELPSYQLEIPAINVNMPISFDDDETIGLSKGAWHFPGSGTPDNPDSYQNIVFSGHRFLYTSGLNTFYNLDQLKTDDEIILHWDKTEYKYKVTDVYIVQPNDVYILKDSPTQKLTLFTCHPPFTTRERLVVDAYPVE
ncbi:MAG: hypothetical protein AUJ28_03855 [Parcubacteria group bacterium CG1_02_37_51]|uniref:Sortase n=2 Tax=Candidatus Komeiliibacteriota TaxID=1817908 RepID=A0A2M8DRY4_9BACT|nr:MAG: hypothetical protein AUJ28_03855 [Parcubacteria group bacterium CG1_02_37_51]PIY94055.1 MAG: hypothetical protein COY67_03145 [Candidatus Komeilibacteria bacterium CG_4_10_14_0_8_um_filter_37_78]PJC02129.1 MAG: hypothetical protein CO073_01085 [Candidatus Komeilibacteria bacterium CG_4_9_14_0_8_um_filter_36_9]